MTKATMSDKKADGLRHLLPLLIGMRQSLSGKSTGSTKSGASLAIKADRRWAPMPPRRTHEFAMLPSLRHLAGKRIESLDPPRSICLLAFRAEADRPARGAVRDDEQGNIEMSDLVALLLGRDRSTRPGDLAMVRQTLLPQGQGPDRGIRSR
jgi:hypothetical protein